jgi:multidrug efflux system outer membrane protein
MKRSPKFLMMGSFILMSGCSYILPNYHKPIIEVPKQWTEHSASMQLTEKNVSELAWWQSFNDAELNRYIERALSCNNQLHVAESLLKESEANLQKIKWSWLPSINASGIMYRGELLNVSNMERIRDLLNNRWDRKSWPYSGYMVGFTPSYTLNFFAKYNETIKTKWDVQAKTQTYRSVRLAVISQTAMSYFNLLGFKKQLNVVMQMLDDMKKQRQYQLIQYQKGAISQVELLNTEQTIEYLKGQIPKIHQAIQLSENSLVVLTNQKLGSIQTHYPFENLNDKHIVLYNIPSTVIKQRPDVLASENELKKYNAQVAEAISMLLPTVNVSALFDNFGFFVGKFLSFTTNIFQGQLSAVIPLIDGSIYGQIKRAKAVEMAAIYNYLGTLSIALADTDTAISARKNSHNALMHINKAYERSKQQYRLGAVQLKNGAISQMQLLTYKINMDRMELKNVQYKQADFITLVRLYQALAGGSCIEKQSKSKANNPKDQKPIKAQKRNEKK